MEIPGKFCNVVLEKDGEDQFDQSMRNEEVLHRAKEDKSILVADRSKARVYGRSLAGIVGSNLAEAMDTCLL
jgi:hypothetical protein